MRIFLYEHLTATGLGREPGDPLHGMYREGLTMRDALAADLCHISDVTVTFDDSEEFDRAIVIAPETDGVLLELMPKYGDRVIGPSGAAVSLTSDKLALAEHWRSHGVRTPATTDRATTRCEAFPVVWKPRDGCGSTATFLLKDAFDLARAEAMRNTEHGGPMILQEFVPGRAASVAFLCGPAGCFPLEPAFQLLSHDDRFHYTGGEVPIPTDLAERAVRLATQAVSCVDGLQGYVGVDLVLGDAADGSRDYAIEINPRLTTSYVGLRAVLAFNLAEEMLHIASGGKPRHPIVPTRRVRFTPDGTVSPVGQV